MHSTIRISEIRERYILEECIDGEWINIDMKFSEIQSVIEWLIENGYTQHVGIPRMYYRRKDPRTYPSLDQLRGRNDNGCENPST